MTVTMTTDHRASVLSLKRQYADMSSKERFKFFVKCLVVTACVCGLLFQLYMLFRQYYSGRTVVNVQIEITKFNKIPAFTVCYPHLISMDSAAQKHKQLLPLFDRYKSLEFNSSESKDIADEIKEVYNNFTAEVVNLDLTIAELFDISIPFGFPILSNFSFLEYLIPITITVKGIRYFRKTNTMTDIVIEDKKPLESIVIGKDSFKCFTFFHHLNESFKEYQIDEKEVSIEIYHNSNWFPPDVYNTSSKFIMFSMHSPNTFPQQMNGENFLRLKAGKWYEISYNRLKTVLLQPPYQTNCKVYNLKATDEHRLRSDCINDCIGQRLDESCFGNKTKNADRDERRFDCFFSYDGLWRRDLIERNKQNSFKLCSNSSLVSCFERNLNRVNRECQVTCQVECDNRFYNYNVKTNNKLENAKLFTLLTIEHNQLPDQITEHMEEMSLIQFIASFGGLTGMWLGLSVVVIPQYFLRFV